LHSEKGTDALEEYICTHLLGGKILAVLLFELLTRDGSSFVLLTIKKKKESKFDREEGPGQAIGTEAGDREAG
jgi:hypothetical protein